MDQPDLENDGGPSYRLYQLGDDGRIKAFSVISAWTDEEAIKKARALVDGDIRELWDCDRLIVRLDPSEIEPE